MIFALASSHVAPERALFRLRDECLNETLFSSLSGARAVLASWQGDYNGVRRHSALANKTPWQFRAEPIAVAASRATSTQDPHYNCRERGAHLSERWWG